ncbi:MAG: NAD(P)/FAD-dependent oxidoreductase [Pseudomonadota bacterium]
MGLTALATTHLLAQTPASNSEHDPVATEVYDVIIVGAGSAGLYAARTLIEEDYKVLLLEAEKQIGGRVRSATLGETRIEMGAEEHYLAEGANPVWPAVTAKFGSSIYVESYQGLEAYAMDGGTNTCWTADDASIDCDRDENVSDFFDVYQWFWRTDLHQDPASTLAQDIKDEFDVGPTHRAYHLYENGLAGASFATSLHRVGARSLAQQADEWDLSSDIRVLGDKDLGYSDVLNALWWDDVVTNSELLLNRPVTRIDTSGERVAVTDATGAVHRAKHVIVTVSVGVLQAEVIEFVPELPSNTVAAYKGIGIDMGMKVALRFSTPWWETRGEPMATLLTEGAAAFCWVPSDYKQDSTDHILMCYPMGDNARALDELAEAAGGGKAGESAIFAAILSDLDRALPRAQGQASAHFEEGLLENWGKNPFTRGVYSFPKKETYPSYEQNLRRALAKPVAGQKLFFAGEATHNTHPSTVVGALHEGERAARAIIKFTGDKRRAVADKSPRR